MANDKNQKQQSEKQKKTPAPQGGQQGGFAQMDDWAKQHEPGS